MAAVGLWFYTAMPPQGPGATSKPIDVAGVKAEQNLPNQNLHNKKVPVRKKSVSRFADDPSVFYEPGEVLVSGADKNIQSAAKVYGFRLIEKSKLQSLNLSLNRFRTPAGFSVKRARRILASRFPASSVDANHHFQIQDQATFRVTARLASDWGPASPTCGRGIRIGIIDTAVDLNHSALRGQKITQQSFHHQGQMMGPSGHGTSIAGMLVGKPTWGGLLPGAQLFAANVYGLRRDGVMVGSAASLAQGIDWLVKNKVHVINLSLAGTNNKIVHNAIQKAANKGIAIVAAAGNWGQGSKRAYPAAFSEVLAVTALSSDRKQLASFASHGDYIDFAAPGSHIWAPVSGGGGRYQSGTSFAAPYISVLAALHTSQGSGKSADKLRKAFLLQTVDMGAKGKDPKFGYGIVNIQPKCI